MAPRPTTFPPRTLSTDKVHLLERGETISELARGRYGSRHYSRLVVMHNEFGDPSRLPVGTKIELPELERVLADAGVGNVAQSALDELFTARETWLLVEPLIDDAMDRALTSPGDDAAADADGGDDFPGQGARAPSKRPRRAYAPLRLSLASDVVDAIEGICAGLERAATQLEALDDDSVRPPLKTAGELRSAAKLLRSIAAGEPPGNFQPDDVHKHLANAMINAVLWGRKGFR